jgi:hypothetical protein
LEKQQDVIHARFGAMKGTVGHLAEGYSLGLVPQNVRVQGAPFKFVGRKTSGLRSDVVTRMVGDQRYSVLFNA